MFDRVLMRKYVSQAALLFWSCAVALFAFAWVRVWVVSLVSMGQFHAILEQIKQFEKFAPIQFDSLLSYSGRVGLTYDEPVVILCIVVWCFARGSDVVSGELSRGTLEMLLSQPIHRRTLLFSHAAVSIIGLVLLCLSLWAGILVGIQNTTLEEPVPPPTIRIPWIEIDMPLQVDNPETVTVPLSDRVNVAHFAAPTFHLFCFGFFLTALASMLSCFDRYRWRTIGIAVGIYVFQFVLFNLGKAAESLQWLLWTSFFSCYKPGKMTALVVDHGSGTPWSLTFEHADLFLAPMFYPLTLLLMGIACYAVATYRLSTRDLPAPL